MSPRPIFQDDLVDRSSWGRGAWDGEPDRMMWQRGQLTCLALRQIGAGYWCGYVGVPFGHPAFGKGLSEVEISSAQHEVNYAELELGKEDPPLYWFGFDCGHAWDYQPGLAADLAAANPGFVRRLFGEQHYWTLEEVSAEIEQLAVQLEKMVK